MSTKRILISKEKGRFGSLRVARVCGQLLQDLEVENTEQQKKVDFILNAEVRSIVNSLEAAFVDFGAERNGFLPLKEIAPEYYPEGVKKHNLSIKDVLFVGQKILVQVTKEERGTKGAALTTYISLAGSYLVLMPNNPKAGGISRRIEGEEREELKQVLSQLSIPDDMGVIVRTAGMGKTTEELQWDLDVLINLWNAIKQASKSYGAPYLIHQDNDVIIRTLRDHLRADTGEILVDDPETYEKVLAYIKRVRPDFVEHGDPVKLYNDPIPLFSRFQIEKQIESIFQRTIRLPSGGEIVIDRTEALTAIDVNSAQATRGTDIEETAINTNLEAAEEIARQLRLRDIGGLIVVDFIDMESEHHRRKVEERLHEAIKNDRARVQMTHISRFGLLEISRQCLRATLDEGLQVICPRCNGKGMIRNVKSQALSMIRLIEDYLLKEQAHQINIQLPVDIATYLLNEQQQTIQEIEKSHNAKVVVVPNPYLQTPQYDIKCLSKKSESNVSMASYELVTPPKMEYKKEETEGFEYDRMAPAVKNVLPDTPAPTPGSKKSPGWFKRLLKSLFGKKEKPIDTTFKKPFQKKPPYRKYNKNFQQRQSRRGGRNNNRRDRRSRPRRDKNYYNNNNRYNRPSRDQNNQGNFNQKERISENKESEFVSTRIETPIKTQEVFKEPQQSPMPKPQNIPTSSRDESDQWIMVETKKDNKE